VPNNTTQRRINRPSSTRKTKTMKTCLAIAFLSQVLLAFQVLSFAPVPFIARSDTSLVSCQMKIPFTGGTSDNKKDDGNSEPGKKIALSGLMQLITAGCAWSRVMDFYEI